jgi:hypothetical protein
MLFNPVLDKIQCCGLFPKIRVLLHRSCGYIRPLLCCISHEDGVRERRRPGPRSRAPTSEQDQAAEGGARAKGRHKTSSFHGGVMTCEAATRVSLSAACTSLRSVPPAADCSGAGVSHGKKLVQIQKGYEPGFVLTVEDFGRADGIHEYGNEKLDCKYRVLCYSSVVRYQSLGQRA